MMREGEMEMGAFRHWLEARREQVVGRPLYAERCPLANWLSQVYGKPCEVYSRDYWCGVERYQTPYWAGKVVLALDERVGARDVCGEEVLAILDGVLAQSGGEEEVW